jgi:imidazolonepropionase-like amidohydrolase
VTRLCLAVALLAIHRLSAQSAPITLRASLLLDGRGAAFRDVTVTIERSKITRVGPSRAAPTYDLAGLTMMPGGIDTHVHLTWHFDPDGRILLPWRSGHLRE